MTKNEYLSALKRFLTGLPEEEIKDIIYDYEEHFRIGCEEGKTEEQIAEELGDVLTTARMYKSDIQNKPDQPQYIAPAVRSNSIVGKLLVTVLLGFFNLVFVLGPFIGFVGVIIGFFGASIGLLLGGIGAFIGVTLAPFFPTIFNTTGASIFFAYPLSIGLTCLGLLSTIGTFYLTGWFCRLTVRYLRWNIDVIDNRGKQNEF